MVIFHHSEDINKFLKTIRKPGSKTGFVPTMGALHAGHLSLIEQCKSQSDFTVCSIFVNPTQFNDPTDYEKYPVTLDNDIVLLEKAGCDALFVPSVKEIYPSGVSLLPHYDLGYLETVLEGKYRPGHFQGVCQVVQRLLEIVEPDVLFLGQKDFQQCMVIKRMTELTNLPVTVTICSTLREADGLAMSSRNMRLNETERKTAVKIYETLTMMKQQLQPGSVIQIKQAATEYLLNEGFRPDYTEFANAGTLELVDDWNGTDKIVALIAAYLNDVRLIDNMIIT
ncbi:MAG: pantoate--beta-alanine ligase [Lacibacter sp.]